MTTEPHKPVAALAADKKADLKPKAATAAKPDTDATKSVMVTLEQLALEMKMGQRDARMLLRLASKQTKAYPNLGKDHIPRQPWQWVPGSKALEEARKALASTI